MSSPNPILLGLLVMTVATPQSKPDGTVPAPTSVGSQTPHSPAETAAFSQAAAAGLSQAATAGQSAFELPAGLAADAVAVITPTTSAHATPSDLGSRGNVPAYAQDAWSKPATWIAWGTLLSAEKDATQDAASVKNAATSGAERRARLALLALEQGRSEAAWAHFAATKSDPTWTAAILPRFLPGVPSGSASAGGGNAAPLADGAILTPSLPPPTRASGEGGFDRRSMSTRSIAIGSAVVSMKVSVENEGVQIDVRHVSGGPAKIAILIPEPPDYTFGNEYVDWYRQDEMHVPHVFEVKPGEEEHTLYGRFEAREQVLRSRVPSTMPSPITLGGLWLVAPDDPGRPLLAAAAQSISTVLGVECKLRAPGEKPFWTGISVDLSVPSERTTKLAWLASAVERFALAPSTAPR